MSKGPVIRFRCSNGHVLQVRAEAAGERGACPQCGVPVVAPELPAKSAAEPAPIKPEAAPQAPKPQAVPAKPTVPKAKPVARPAMPPQAEAARWYLRSATGEQYGPATDEQFCQWITDRRVGPESYVWREGWADWQRASQVAGELPAPLAPMLSPTPTAGAAQRYRRRRTQSTRMRSLMAMILLVLTLCLGGVFAYVVVTQTSGSSKTPAQNETLGEAGGSDRMPDSPPAGESDEPVAAAPDKPAPNDDPSNAPNN